MYATYDVFIHYDLTITENINVDAVSDANLIQTVGTWSAKQESVRKHREELVGMVIKFPKMQFP